MDRTRTANLKGQTMMGDARILLDLWTEDLRRMHQFARDHGGEAVLRVLEQYATEEGPAGQRRVDALLLAVVWLAALETA
jgi:hypothetical protein